MTKSRKSRTESLIQKIERHTLAMAHKYESHRWFIGLADPNTPSKDVKGTILKCWTHDRACEVRDIINSNNLRFEMIPQEINEEMTAVYYFYGEL